jgi:restriction system protein
MAKKTLIEDLLDAIQSACFHLPFWFVPIFASIAAGGAYWFVNKAFVALFAASGASAGKLPLYAAGIAFFLVFAAGTAGWVQRRQRKDILAQTNSLERLRNLSWREFELLIAEAYRAAGFTVKEGAGNAPDGGIDIDTCSPTGERVLIQCKHWKRQKIGVPIVREMLGVLTREAADKVIIICTGDFTQEAIKWAEGQPIQLVNGCALLKQLEQYQAESPATTAQTEPQSTEEQTTPSNTECCPQCGSQLTIRTARRGNNAGKQFWGCSNYPRCKYTRTI